MNDGFYYFHSTVAQVVATLVGLLLASYSLYQNYLKNLMEKDDSYSDAVRSLLRTQSKRVKFFLLTSFTIIVVSLVVLYVSQSLQITEEIMLVEIYIIMLFVYQTFRLISKMINQDAISEQADSILEKLNPSKTSVTLQEFMHLYIKLEKEIENRFYKHYRNLPEKFFSVSRMVGELIYVEPEIEIMSNEIREIIKVRNLLVHGKTEEVPMSTFNVLKYVIEKMKIDNDAQPAIPG